MFAPAVGRGVSVAGVVDVVAAAVCRGGERALLLLLLLLRLLVTVAAVVVGRLRGGVAPAAPSAAAAAQAGRRILREKKINVANEKKRIEGTRTDLVQRPAEQTWMLSIWVDNAHKNEKMKGDLCGIPPRNEFIEPKSSRRKLDES